MNQSTVNWIENLSQHSPSGDWKKPQESKVMEESWGRNPDGGILREETMRVHVLFTCKDGQSGLTVVVAGAVGGDADVDTGVIECHVRQRQFVQIGAVIRLIGRRARPHHLVLPSVELDMRQEKRSVSLNSDFSWLQVFDFCFLN